MPIVLPKLYPITDPYLTGLSHTVQLTRLVSGGATFVQLRDKHASPRELFDEAEQAVRFARSHGVKLILNDRVDLAMALGADGVHLGQDDIPPEAARRLLGPSALIGYSTHSVEQAVRAITLPIDYLAIGPIFPTSSKENPDPVVGLDGLRRVRDAIGQIPLVAIGGITMANASDAIRAGADSVAVISGLLADTSQIETRVRDFLSILSN
jgi:thiamine-phosphate pyrophosphorylase